MDATVVTGSFMSVPDVLRVPACRASALFPDCLDCAELFAGLPFIR